MESPRQSEDSEEEESEENSIYNPLRHLTRSTVLYSTYLTDCFYAGK